MRYAAARYDQKRRGDAYRFYISECLRMISENTARSYSVLSRGNEGASYMEKRLSDILDPSSKSSRKLVPGEPTRNIRRLFS